MVDYLVELLLEEMPPADVDTILDSLGEIAKETMKGAKLSFEKIEIFSTSRRFGLIVTGLNEKQEDVILRKRGPAKKIAYKDGKPTRALEGFLRSNDATVEETKIEEVNGTEYVFLNKKIDGKPVKEILKEVMPQIFSKLQFKKPMRWGNGEHKYVRPLHSILSLLGNEIVEFEFLGKKASNTTISHRFLSKTLRISSVEEYTESMKKNMVIVSVNERKKMIEDALKNCGSNVVEDKVLVHEISLITEYPQAVIGEFKEKYLALPEPVLKTVLRHHQRTFITQENGRVSRRFVAFQDGPASREKNVKKGYERVINARLEDAIFYYKEDTSQPLEKFVPKLKEVTFQRDLGTLWDKMERVRKLSEEIAKELNFSNEEKELVKRAAYLSKADIATSMIYEFPELQGTMAKIYALRTENERVAQALQEQYMPEGLEGEVPTDPVGAVIGLADRLDTVTANFAIGQIPSGSRDPYGLRKNTFGILRILNEFEWDLSVKKLAGIVEDSLNKSVPWKEFEEFFEGRLEVLLKERYSISYDIVRSVLPLWDKPLRARLCAQSVEKYKSSDDFEDFITAYTRVHNISKKHDSTEYHVELFEKEEKPLFSAYLEVKPKVEEALEHLNYDEAFEHLKSLKPFIDEYFDNVFVMATREDLRRNRLGFLKSLDELFLKFGDLSSLLKN